MLSPLLGQVDRQGHIEVEFNGGLAGVPAFSPLFLEPAAGLLRVIWFDLAITVLAGSALRRRRIRSTWGGRRCGRNSITTQQFTSYSSSARAAVLPAKPLLIGV